METCEGNNPTLHCLLMFGNMFWYI
uniref:Uncharacterized protein n=1 Tax=Anguilla anguilla TaxID=7936 RepID=A0A0E9UWE7_ANGAN